MQQIGNDMDDLFRKASDNYPLNAQNSDWDTVLAGLKEGDDDKPVAIPFSSRNNLHYLWLLLLLPLGLLVAKYAIRGNDSSKNATLKQENSIQQKNATLPSPEDNSTVQLGKLQPSNNNSSNKSNNTENNFKTKIASVNNGISGEVKNLKDLNNANLNYIKQNNLPLVDVTKNNSITDNYNSVQLEQNKEASIPGKENNTNAISPSNLNSTANNSNNNTQSTEAKKQPITLSKQKRFYMGIIVSPDFTTVKFQSVKKVGLNFGVLMGYQVTNKLNAELGVLLDSKYYYTDAKYFDDNAIRKDVVNLQSFSSITEIPINLRYNFKTTASTQYFASAGAVSYIIHNQRYDYVYEKDGQLQEGEKQYRKASNNVFSNIQLSVGYEHALGKLGDLRIEPYYRIPIHGLGIGNVPITSVGVNIGIIKKIK